MSDEMRDVRETLGAPQEDTFLSDEARRREAQKRAAEAGEDTLDMEVGDTLEVGDELDLSAQAPEVIRPPEPEVTRPPGEIAVSLHREQGEREFVTLTVDGEERARAFVDEIDPEVLKRAQATTDVRQQAAILWPDPPQAPAGEVSAAEGLKQQMVTANGTAYLIFRHENVPDAASDVWKAGIDVKTAGGDAPTELRVLLPIAVGSFTGAPAALLAARERFGEGDYVAIPRRNITAKTWKKQVVDKWA